MHSEYLVHSGIRGIILVVELIVVPPTTISLLLFLPLFMLSFT